VVTDARIPKHPRKTLDLSGSSNALQHDRSTVEMQTHDDNDLIGLITGELPADRAQSGHPSGRTEVLFLDAPENPSSCCEQVLNSSLEAYSTGRVFVSAHAIAVRFGVKPSKVLPAG
jgi:hypothetical protein